LSFSDREDIAIWRAQGLGIREIARGLSRCPSTISRELHRNASTRAARAAGMRVVAVCGGSELAADRARVAGIDQVFTLTDLELCMAHAGPLLPR